MMLLWTGALFSEQMHLRQLHTTGRASGKNIPGMPSLAFPARRLVPRERLRLQAGTPDPFPGKPPGFSPRNPALSGKSKPNLSVTNLIKPLPLSCALAPVSVAPCHAAGRYSLSSL